MKKFVFIGVGVLAVGIVAMIILTVLNLGKIIKTATETYGPEITKTDVRLGSADISILSGSGSLEKFFLGNPKGFTMPSAIECDTIRIKVVTDSLTSDKIIIDEIYIDGPIISYEKKGNTDNFKTIVDNINKTIAGDKKTEQQKPDEKSDTGAEKKIQINNFIVKNGRINLGGSLLSSFGNENGLNIEMPDIHIKDIGKDKETSPAEAFAIVLGQMTGDVAGTVTQVGKKLTETLDKAVEGVGSGAKSVGGTIKGLFGSE